MEEDQSVDVAEVAVGPIDTMKKDYSYQKLYHLPQEILTFHHVTELNLMANFLSQLPEEICHLKYLTRLGLKDNQLIALPENLGNLSALVELYVTNNQLTRFPTSIGRLKRLRKLQASFNKLEAIPDEIRDMTSLELFRASVNPSLLSLPLPLGQAPSLSWCSFAGSQYCLSKSQVSEEEHRNIPVVSMDDVDLGMRLGEGASGEVFLGRIKEAEGSRNNFNFNFNTEEEVAIKIFKSDVGPDGRALDELAIMYLLASNAESHPNLPRVRAIISHQSSALTSAVGVVMDLAQGKPLAEKPNHSSVLRCRWPKDRRFSLSFVYRMARQVASALLHLHGIGICHGDVYAHNILAVLEEEEEEEKDGTSAPIVTLLDYGASFLYKDRRSSSAQGSSSEQLLLCDFERIEVRAYGLFLSDLCQRIDQKGKKFEDQQREEVLLKLQERCLLPQVQRRPTFSEIYEILQQHNIR